MIYDKLQTIPDEDILRLKKQAPFSDAENKMLAKISSVIECVFCSFGFYKRICLFVWWKCFPFFWNKTSKLTLEEFNEILMQHKHIFHESRSAKKVKKQWLLLKKYDLLNDQEVEETRSNDQGASSSNTSGSDLNISFEDKEKLLNDNEIMENVNLNEDVEEGRFTTWIPWLDKCLIFHFWLALWRDVKKLQETDDKN